MDKKLMVYLFGKNAIPIARYKEWLSGYELVSLVSPISWGYTGKEVSQIDRKEKTGYIIKSDFYEELKGCDAIYINHEPGKMITDSNAEHIKEAIKQGKEILISGSLAKELKQHKIFSDHYKILDEKATFKAPENIVDIDVPIVLVYGLGENTHKFDIQLLVARHFKEEGYTVSQIGTKRFSGLFGIEAIPEFLFERQYSVAERVRAFNYFVQDKVDKEEADVMIIGVPGAIMPMFYNDVNNIGVLPLIICNAIKADIVIMTTYHNNYDMEYYKKLKLYSEYKYNYPADYFYVSNTRLSRDMETNMIRSEYDYIDEEDLGDRLPCGNGEFKIINKFSKDNYKVYGREIIDNLASNVNLV